MHLAAVGRSLTASLKSIKNPVQRQLWILIKNHLMKRFRYYSLRKLLPVLA